MPTKWLPDSANIDHLKRQAKDLLRDFRDADMSAFQRAREFHPKFAETPDNGMTSRSFALSDAQLSIAREYGYASWPRLRAAIADRSHETLALTHNERLPDGPFKQALDFMDAGNEARLKDHLARHPGLIHEEALFEGGNYFQTPTLLEFLPENPNRQERIPANALKIAEILLEAGAAQNQEALNETVMLAASGRICRESGLQNALIELLCQHGADPEAGMYSALAHDEFDAARALIECGAKLNLPAAAALDERVVVKSLLNNASSDDIQLALALAACCGRAEVAKLLLAGGADPNRYNPPGGHSHCTPLHSAVAAKKLDTVKALMEGGADLSLTDIHHKMTALGWAEYLKHDDIADYLRSTQN
ncbi:MAG: ankyrin repeat domain-containing protein [Litoreibacter sp.]|nr:ankyrin repeat domain-containing protein [Litoreibacter sp.]MCY4333758.1 ankyrin repeat domain-containing protein [Litoreibacter sp.]